MLNDVLLVTNQPIEHFLKHMRANRLQLRYSLDNVHHQVKAVQVIQHHHIERGSCGSLLFVAAHVQVLVIRAPVCQPMD